MIEVALSCSLLNVSSAEQHWRVKASFMFVITGVVANGYFAR